MTEIKCMHCGEVIGHSDEGEAKQNIYCNDCVLHYYSEEL